MEIKRFFTNRWTRFAIAAVAYVLLFVVWTGNLWLLLGLPLIFDYYISRLFYRYVWHYNDELCARSRLYKSVYEWVSAIVFAVVVATLIHLFVFQLYVIPSSSMEKSLLVGDYLYVSKVAYGPQVPNTPLSFPFVHHTMPFSQTRKSFSEAVQWSYHRLKGLGEVQRGDVVVFNFPAGDTVLVENQSVTYYDVLRDYQRAFGREAGRKRLYNDYTVVHRPVDKRENYVKRCVAVAGDTISVVDGEVYIDGELMTPPAARQFVYRVRSASPISAYLLENMGVTEWSGGNGEYYMTLTDEAAGKVADMKGVSDVERVASSFEVFPYDRRYAWTQDNFGPLWVPAKGATIRLTTDNLPLYSRVIETYEGNTLRTEGDTIYINGEPADEYTFRMDYYFMMGDNRHNSADSRFWGFVPEDHIVGKPSFVVFSKDKGRGIRFNRIFRKVR